jgi:hypothetical protein
MTTILILNAVSSLIAATGIGGFLTWRTRQAARRNALVQPIYVPPGD